MSNGAQTYVSLTIKTACQAPHTAFVYISLTAPANIVGGIANFGSVPADPGASTSFDPVSADQSAQVVLLGRFSSVSLIAIVNVGKSTTVAGTISCDPLPSDLVITPSGGGSPYTLESGQSSGSFSFSTTGDTLENVTAAARAKRGK